MRSIQMTRDEAEILVRLIDTQRPDQIDGRVIELSEEIRKAFGMVTYKKECEIWWEQFKHENNNRR